MPKVIHDNIAEQYLLLLHSCWENLLATNICCAQLLWLLDLFTTKRRVKVYMYKAITICTDKLHGADYQCLVVSLCLNAHVENGTTLVPYASVCLVYLGLIYRYEPVSLQCWWNSNPFSQSFHGQLVRIDTVWICHPLQFTWVLKLTSI